MIDIGIHNCKNCSIEIFNFEDGETTNPYEDFTGTIPHTKLRCEINQIISDRISQLEIELRQIKEKLNLE